MCRSSSQERRADIVLVIINRSSDAHQPVVNRSPCSPIRFKLEIPLFVLPKKIQDGCLRCSGSRNGRSSPDRDVPRRLAPLPPPAARPSPLRAAPLRRNPPRPACQMSGLWIRQIAAPTAKKAALGDSASACIYVYIYIYICVCVCAYIYIYIYIHA